VEALRAKKKKERQDETQFINLGGKKGKTG